MKKACLVVGKNLTQNRIFETSLHRDNCLDRFAKLKHAMQEEGYDLSTHDINGIDASEIVIYAANMPKRLPINKHIKKSYLILSESPFIRPDNFDVEKHKYFNKVFTWADELVDGKKYIKLNYAHAFPEHIDMNLSNKKKLCVLIASNKKPKPALPDNLLARDLYSERESAIRWFEANHLHDFDLYGIGWDAYCFSGSKRVLNRVPLLPRVAQKLIGGSYPSYKGMIKHKKPVMGRYKFSICYENCKDISGYVTEKIFDSFFAACVPVYLGADNVAQFIPKNTFIDKREFHNYDDLYWYLKSISDVDYFRYLQNIQAYLNSEHSLPFKSEGFARTIIETVCN